MYHGSPKAGLFRRLAAIVYDVLILAALWMLAMGLALLLVTILDKLGLVSLAAYQDQADFIQKHSLGFSCIRCWCFYGFTCTSGSKQVKPWACVPGVSY